MSCSRQERQCLNELEPGIGERSVRLRLVFYMQRFGSLFYAKILDCIELNDDNNTFWDQVMLKSWGLV